MTKQEQNERIIDVDVVIDNYNKKHPKLKPMTRSSLAELLECNKQIFSDWKGGKTPKLVSRLFQLKEIGNCKFEDFIKD